MELQISMIPSPEDPPWRSDDYQSELRKLGLALRGGGLEIHEVGSHPVRSGETSPISGEWRVKLGATLEPILKAPVGFWLQARRGRTARLRIGETKRTYEPLKSLRGSLKLPTATRKSRKTSPKSTARPFHQKLTILDCLLQP